MRTWVLQELDLLGGGLAALDGLEKAREAGDYKAVS